MPVSRPLLALSLVLATGLGSSGCTLVKPVVGAVTGPVVMLAATDGHVGCGCDPYAGLAVLGVGAAIGAVAGLVTGLISDIQWLCGEADDPCRNWWNPVATNTMPDTRW